MIPTLVRSRINISDFYQRWTNAQIKIDQIKLALIIMRYSISEVNFDTK